MTVKVLPYDPKWPEQYKALASAIKTALSKDIISIHHVGSTSIPGLSAKEKIDIIAEVNDLCFPYQDLLGLGYKHRGGFNIPLRKTFSLRDHEIDVNLHIFETGDPEVELNLLFRDYLRHNEAARDSYGALKYDLLKEESSHKMTGAFYKGYTLGKNDFIGKIIQATGFNGLRFIICTHHSEWKAAKEFRREYFFDPSSSEDPYLWTFDHPDHKHLVLYQGVRIVAYAHVQLWPKQRAAIRIIAVDEGKRGESLGRHFIQLIEKWLIMEGYKSLHTTSSPQAVGFYKKLGYIPMDFGVGDDYERSPHDIEMGKILGYSHSKKVPDVVIRS